MVWWGFQRKRRSEVNVHSLTMSITKYYWLLFLAGSFIYYVKICAICVCGHVSPPFSLSPCLSWQSAHLSARWSQRKVLRKHSRTAAAWKTKQMCAAPEHPLTHPNILKCVSSPLFFRWLFHRACMLFSQANPQFLLPYGRSVYKNEAYFEVK